jgi:hypothetical protein
MNRRYGSTRKFERRCDGGVVGRGRRDEVVVGDATIDVPEVLLTESDPDAAHITAVRAGDGGWLISYDARYNARQAAEHGAAARELLDSARTALMRGGMRAFAENLFSACELMAKAYLLTLPEDTSRAERTDRWLSPSTSSGKRSPYHASPAWRTFSLV